MKADTFKVKKPRVDKRKNVGKVAEALIKNPNKTVREIAQETNMSIGAVHSSKIEVEQSWTKDETIAYIVDKSRERIKNISRVLDHKTKKILDKVEKDEDIDNKDIYLLKDIAKDDQSRVAVLWWTITDDKGWLRDMTDVSMKEIEERIKHLLW